jgi:RNA polymerase subunit RPABC4/transcription elongation factor Spt4
LQLDEAVAQGVLWINSSGNTALSHYRGKFTDTDGNGYHEFYQGDEIMGFMTPGPVGIALNWDDWENGTQDFDMYIFDEESNLIASSENTQNGPDSGAFEVVYYQFEREVPYYVVIKKVRADRDVTFDLLMNDGILEYYSPEYSLSPPADAFGAFTVGATKWENDQLEDYSSQGPTDDGRIKPDISAPTGVSSAAYGDTWVGTSASCPHVTGAAALVMQAFPEYSPDQVKEFLINRAIDLGSSGADNQTGYGRLWLGDPVESAGVEPLPTAVEPTEVSQPTEVAIKGPAATSKPTSTPDLEKQPGGSADKIDLTGMLIFLACVGLPGLLGLAGIGILGAVFFTMRSRNGQRTSSYAGWREPGQPTPAMPPEPRPAPAAEASPLMERACPNCGKLHQPGTKFCTKCGYELTQELPAKAVGPQFCSKCGSALRSDSKFCPNCGHKIR